MAAYRYWKISFRRASNVGNGSIKINELQLRESPGGSAITGATVTAYSPSSGNPVANINDGNTANYFETNWVTDNPYDNWVKFDYGSGNAKDIKELAIYLAAYRSDNPVSVAILGSNDDVTYDLIAQHRNWANPTVDGWLTFPVVKGAQKGRKWWRIRFTGMSASDFDLTRFMLCNETGGQSTLPFGTTATANTVTGEANTFLTTAEKSDRTGGTQTFYSYYGAYGQPYLEITLRCPDGWTTEAKEVVLDVYNHNKAPTGFVLSYSDDGSTWTVAHTASGLTWPEWGAGPAKTFAPADSGAVANPNAHRYWRVLVSRMQGSPTTANTWEIQLRETPGGTNLSPLATTTSQTGDFSPNNVKDNNLDTYWESAARDFPTTQWVRFDFGTVTPREITEVSIAGGQFNTENFRDFIIQWSDNGTAWTDAAIYGNVDQWPGDGKSFKVFPVSIPVQTGRRYWRLVGTAFHDASYLNFYKVLFEKTAGDGKQALICGTAAVTHAAFAGAAALGNILNPAIADVNWETANNAAQFRLTYTLPAALKTTVDRVTIKNGQFASEALKTFRIEYSDNGTTWVVAGTFTNVPAWSAGETRTYTLTDNGGATTPPEPPAVTIGKKKLLRVNES